MPQTLQILILILKHLPQIMRLIDLLEKAQREASTQREISKDLIKINEAFEAKDAKKLQEIFSS